MVKIIGLIPARKDSKRIPGKNMALLNGKPLLQYAIESATQSAVFDEIVVSSDWDKCMILAENLGVNFLRRPDKLCQDFSHDFEWVKHALDAYPGFDIFVILRPTSPFRTGETIKRAVQIFMTANCDSMRAVSMTTCHPRKSWVLDGKRMIPLMEDDTIGWIPAHDLPTQDLGHVYCQNGCIHVAKTSVIEEFGNVTGRTVAPFFTRGHEGLDINTPEDLQYAEWVMRGKP